MICEEITVPGKGNATLARFTGLADLANAAESHRWTNDYAASHGARFAGADLPTALHRARYGSPDLVAASDALLARLEAINPPAHAFETQRAVVGGVPSVPDFLSGNPVNMRLRRRVQTQGAPIAILFNTSVNHDVAPETILRRGAAALALVRCLSAVRPVTLYLFSALRCDGKDVFLTIPIDTAPLDLARAAWALSAPEVARNVILNATNAVAKGKDQAYPPAFDYSWSRDNAARLAADCVGVSDFVAVSRLDLGSAFDSDRAAADWVAANAAA